MWKAVVLSVMLFQLFAGVTTAAERVALVIGNNDYEYSGDLSSPIGDAKLMAKILQEFDFQVVVRFDQTLEDMKQAISSFGKRLTEAGHNAEALFYFSGHGAETGGVNYLLPVDVQGDLAMQAVPLSWVLNQMERAAVRTNIVILDACRNDPYKGSRGGLGWMSAPTGTWIAFAAAPGEVAYDGPGIGSQYSPFTKAFVEAMQPGEQVEDIFKVARRAVREMTDNRQHPWSASSLEGQFYFQRFPSGSQSAAMEALDRISANQKRRINRAKKRILFLQRELGLPQVIPAGRAGEERLMQLWNLEHELEDELHEKMKRDLQSDLQRNLDELRNLRNLLRDR